jgi:hypothetical protein
MVFMVLFVFLVSIFATVAFYATTAKPGQPFMAFGVYSSQGALSAYTGSNLTVNINEQIDWSLHVTNEMGTIQFVQVVPRIGNTTSNAPNATTPSAVPPTLKSLVNLTMFVPEGVTAVMSFDWRIVAINERGGLDYISLNIDGQLVNSTVGTPPSYQLRFFFELWTFNESSSIFEYGWQGVDSRVSSWLQVWFNISR